MSASEDAGFVFPFRLPDAWAPARLPNEAARLALTAVAQLDGPGLEEAAAAAAAVLESAASRPRIVLLAGVVAGEPAGDSTIELRVRIEGELVSTRAWIRADLRVSPAAAGLGPWPAWLLSRAGCDLAMGRVVADHGDFLTVELFSRTDQYEIDVPSESALDPMATWPHRALFGHAS